jgi:hypothetical protein
MALTQSQLSDAICMVPGCAHSHHGDALFFHSQCHPQAPVTACYVKTRGVLVLRCHRCSALVAEVKVAQT